MVEAPQQNPSPPQLSPPRQRTAPPPRPQQQRKGAAAAPVASSIAASSSPSADAPPFSLPPRSPVAAIADPGRNPRSAPGTPKSLARTPKACAAASGVRDRSSPIPSGTQPGQPPVAAAASLHHSARSERPCHFPVADGGGGLGEIGSQVKIAGVARDQAVEKSSPLPCSTIYRHTAPLDGGAMSSGGPGHQQDGGGAKGFFAHVLEDEVYFDQVSVLVSADPGAEGEGSSAPVCGGEISSSIPDDGKTFVEPRQTSRDTKVCTEFSQGCSAGVHHIWEVSFSISKDASKVD
ncbi:hypothetical protein ZWY2020_015076 [Hordeum vulgare]|nr:hypothetical protein ZWY2020_015076 [Hordeum vulgare]